jgi:hypothetical protein
MDANPLIALLTAEPSPLRAQLAALLVDHVLEQPLDGFVDVAGLTPLVTQALSAPNVERAIERHVLPGFRRVVSELERAGETVGDAVPEPARAEIEAMASNPRGPRFGWLRGAVAPDALRAVVGPVVQEVLVQFARNLPIAGKAAASGTGTGAGSGSVVGGLIGRLGRGTEALVSVGKSVADGLGVDLQAKLQDAARDYSQGATAVVQQAIRTRLQQPDGQAAVERIARQVTAHVLGSKVGDIIKDADRLPLERAFRVAPAILAHNVQRERVQQLIASELTTYLALEGQRSLGELLGEYGLRDSVRGWAVAQVDREAGALFAAPAFAQWLATALAG